jgi:hypothetical protein
VIVEFVIVEFVVVEFVIVIVEFVIVEFVVVIVECYCCLKEFHYDDLIIKIVKFVYLM